MNDTYVEILVKRASKYDKSKFKKLATVLITILFCTAVMSGSLFVYILAVLVVVAYYFVIQLFDIEFEYYYLDGELDISKIYNHSRRKTVMTLNESMIKIIAPQGAEILEEYDSLKTVDYSANDPKNLPMVMICEYKKELRRVLLQVDSGLLKELKRNMPNKVKIY